jgi:nitroimidazol reductase NimA-like FMN-containing flavoprotein (pyridoxamine 5'-phosphate oxidase superfamily)
MELSAEECWDILREGRVAHVAVVDRGEPYVTPVSYVVVDGRLAFRSAPGRRAEALERDPQVCVAVTEPGDGGWRSVVLRGEARFVDDPHRHAEVVAALLAKYSSEIMPGFTAPAPFPEERRVVTIAPVAVTGRADGAALRPGRL